MRNRLAFLGFLAASLAGACGAPTEKSSTRSSSSSQALTAAASRGANLSRAARFGRAVTPRSIKPAITPIGLDARPVKVMVRMDGDPITVAQARSPDRKLTLPEKTVLRDALRTRQAPVRRSVEALGANVMREYQNAYNGFAVSVPRRQLAALRQLPGVVGVHPVRVMRPSLTNAVPFVRAPQAWDGSGGATSVHGEGIKVAVIDTGIDYTHANFGGPGTAAAYEAAHVNEALAPDETLFGPKAPRIKGGIDLVGDAYNEDLNADTPGTSVPHPDPNPLDCNGHGSHVAGIVGGSGVTADGHTYAGPYDATTYASAGAFRIGPGVAPRVDLYSVRLFGCEGSVSTDIVVDAIEWAVDNDMDVINMSLGGPFGGADDAGAVAASNAVQSGVIVVASSGNSGPSPYMAGTPATGDGVLSVAALDAAASIAAATLTGDGDSALKPNVIAPGVSVVSTRMGSGTEGVALSGTSMASPVVAGLAALTRQAHRRWSAHDVATAISNTADPGLVSGYSTRIAGAGVPQADRAVKTAALATASGAPALSFGFLELASDVTRCQDIVIRNREQTSMTFDVSIPSAFIQGVPHTLAAPTSVRVPARGTAQLSVQLGVSPTSSIDSLAFNDFAGIIQLTPTSPRTNHGVEVRVPYYGVVRPEAHLTATLDGPGSGRQSGTATLSNLDSAIPGTADFYSWGIAGVQDPIGCNDVRAVGVQSSPGDAGDRVLVFAIQGWRRCSNAAINEYDVIVTNQNGEKFAVVGADAGALETGDPNGEFATLVVNIATGESTLMPGSAPTDSAVVYVVALASQLGLSQETPRFTYFTETFNSWGEGEPDPTSEVASFNAYSSALLVQAGVLSLAPNATTTVPVKTDATEWALTPPKGLMVVFAENAPGPDQAALLAIPDLARAPAAELQVSNQP